MSRSPHSNVKFWTIAAVVIAASAATVAGSLPKVQAFANWESTQLVKEADNASASEAETDYQLAVWLNPDNQQAYANLGAAQFAANNSSAALPNLNRAGEGIAVTELRVKSLLELNRPTAARLSVQELARPGEPEDAIVLAALADCVDNHAQDVTQLTPLVTSPGAVRRIQLAQAGGISLAEVLYTTGLLNSSSAILSGLGPSFSRDLLLGQVDYQQGKWTQAEELAQAATQNDPASVQAHQLLADVYTKERQPSLAAQQQVLLAQISSGKP